MQTEQQEFGVRSQVCASARWRGYFDNKYPLSINTFLPYISNGHLSSLDDVCLLFFCHWMFLNFSVISSKITFDCDIFFSFGILGCHCIAILFLHDYCSIEAALVQYQILLKEVMLNQKFVCYS